MSLRDDEESLVVYFPEEIRPIITVKDYRHQMILSFYIVCIRQHPEWALYHGVIGYKPLKPDGQRSGGGVRVSIREEVGEDEKKPYRIWFSSLQGERRSVSLEGAIVIAAKVIREKILDEYNRLRPEIGRI